MSKNKSAVAASIKKGNWASIPNELWEIPELSIYAKATFCYLMSQSDTWNAGLRGIAAGISASRTGAQKAIDELSAAGMIDVEKMEKGLRSIYTLKPMSSWKYRAPKSKEQMAERVSSGETRLSSGMTVGVIGDDTSKKNPKKNKTRTDLRGEGTNVIQEEAIVDDKAYFLKQVDSLFTSPGIVDATEALAALPEDEEFQFDL